MTNPDFTYTGTLSTSSSVQKPINVAEPISAAARLAFEIQAKPIAQWKAEIEAIVDETIRRHTRTILERRWREAKHREKVDREGKRTPAGDAAIAALAKRL